VTSTVALVADSCVPVSGDTCAHLCEYCSHTDYEEGRDVCTVQTSGHCYCFTSYEPASKTHVSIRTSIGNELDGEEASQCLLPAKFCTVKVSMSPSSKVLHSKRQPSASTSLLHS
jgi:hypothetical protein